MRKCDFWPRKPTLWRSCWKHYIITTFSQCCGHPGTMKKWKLTEKPASASKRHFRTQNWKFLRKVTFPTLGRIFLMKVALVALLGCQKPWKTLRLRSVLSHCPQRHVPGSISTKSVCSSPKKKPKITQTLEIQGNSMFMPQSANLHQAIKNHAICMELHFRTGERHRGTMRSPCGHDIDIVTWWPHSIYVACTRTHTNI